MNINSLFIHFQWLVFVLSRGYSSLNAKSWNTTWVTLKKKYIWPTEMKMAFFRDLFKGATPCSFLNMFQLSCVSPEFICLASYECIIDFSWSFQTNLNHKERCGSDFFLSWLKWKFFFFHSGFNKVYQMDGMG